MSVASSASAHRLRAPERPRQAAPEPKRNWEKIGVMLAIAVQILAGVWIAAGDDRRIKSLEEQLPPGSIQRLDERTIEMKAMLERLEARELAR